MSDRIDAPWLIRAAARLLRPVLDEVARQRVEERELSATVVPFVTRHRRLDPDHNLPPGQARERNRLAYEAMRRAARAAPAGTLDLQAPGLLPGGDAA